MNERNYSKVPVFENGMAQPVFPFTDGKTGADYDPKTSDIVRRQKNMRISHMDGRWKAKMPSRYSEQRC